MEQEFHTFTGIQAQQYIKQKGWIRIQIVIEILRAYYVPEMMKKFINLACSAIVQFLLILKTTRKFLFLCLLTDVGFISVYFYFRSFWWSAMISLGKTNQHWKPYFHSAFLILSTSSYCCLRMGMPVPNSMCINSNVQRWDKVGRGKNLCVPFEDLKQFFKNPQAFFPHVLLTCIRSHGTP